VEERIAVVENALAHEPMSRESEAMPAFLAGGGEMGARVRAHDWSKTVLGPARQWPQSLQTAVSTCLHCSFPIITWWGRDLIVIYNDAYSQIIGNKHPWALGQRGQDLWREIWPVIRPMLERVLDHAQASPADDLLLMLERRGYSEECYFSFSYSPIYDESGGVGGVFCPVIETTEKIIGARRLETLRELAALRRAETVTEACQQAVAVLAKNGRDVPFAQLYLLSEDSASASLAAVTADPSETTLDTPLAQVKQWPLADALKQPTVLEDLAGKELPTGSWSQPPQQVYLAPVILPGSQRSRAVLVIGLNPHKRLDQTYRSFLELLVAQVGSTIADTIAYEAERKRAEALAQIDRAKTAFFSNVSHEFRTPLTLMLGPLEDMKRDLGGSESFSASQYVQIDLIHRNGLRLLKLVNSLLDFSRIEAGRVQASYEPVDLSGLTAQLASNFRSAVERAGLALVVDCPPLSQPVFVDRDMWEKIVLNLLSNAFKFTFEGEIAVTMRGDAAHAELLVRDTGVGVAPNELPRLFERFHRIEGQESRTYEGSGIGLALVQELVHLHGGSIRAESEPGRGTTFTVQIPFGTAHLPEHRIGAVRRRPTSMQAVAYVQEVLRWLPDSARAADAIIDGTEMPGSVPAVRQGGRILLADDNADMRAYVRHLLAPHFDVQAVADGEEALQAIRTHRPDLVLADVMMPRLDGFGLLRAIRRDESLRDLPVIMLSARAGEEARVEGLDAGADDYLIKPFSARELLARVESHLKMAQVRHKAAEALRQRTEQFETLLDRAPFGIYLVDADFRIRQVNPVALPRFGDILGGVIGRDFGEIIHTLREKEYADEIERIFRHTLETGEPYVAPEGVGTGGNPTPLDNFEWRLDRILLPDGRYGVVCYFRDISERVRREQALRESEARFRSLADSAPALIWLYGVEGVEFVNRRYLEFLGATFADIRDEAWVQFVHPDDRTHYVQSYRRAVEDRSRFECEVRLRRHDGEYRTMQSVALPRLEVSGEYLGYTGVTIDITEQKRAERAKEVMIAELHHRTRNLLAVVRSISEQTLAKSASLDDFSAQFNDRLSALSRVQGLLARDGGAAIAIGDLVRQELKALGAEISGDRVRLEGGSVMLPKDAVQILLLVLHELATNALKHGALRSTGGALTVKWRTKQNGKGARLLIEWVESGVDLDPESIGRAQRGYGRQLIEQALPYQLDAEASFMIHGDGIRCTIDMPLGERV
jgi:PAS domain S-box-containing protein